jgi:NTP pyrophosphatase (non-canonical NTP hydrolase)
VVEAFVKTHSRHPGYRVAPLEVSLRCAQRAMRRAYFERDSKRGLYATFTWLVEEVGELAEALLGKRGPEGVREEIADVLAWLLSIANIVGVDVEEAFLEKYRGDLEAAGCISRT